MENQEKHKLKEWLDKIQQDSWQLELVVTAFSIFLVLGALDALDKMEVEIDLLVAGSYMNGTFISVSWVVLMIATMFVLINLIIHVVLRGLWISAIGLRSVSGDIDFENLRLSPRFDQFIRRKTGSFDTYIERLENLCSIAFAFTFLVVFVIISFGMWALLMGLTTELALKFLPAASAEQTVTFVNLLIFITGAIYMIDFITLGWLKRFPRFSKVYYPIYRFYGFVTLSALYRPMYYNFIDNKLGRRAGFFLIPYIVGMLWLMSLQVESHVWFTEGDAQLTMNRSFYDDMRQEESLVRGASIPSRFVSNGYLELFIRYIPHRDDKVLEKKCPEVKPPITSGVRSSIVLGGGPEQGQDFPSNSLACISSLYELYIDDSLFQTPVYRFYQHPNEGERGLLTTLDLQYLPRGEHEVILKKMGRDTVEDSKAIILRDFVRFPFWKE